MVSGIVRTQVQWLDFRAYNTKQRVTTSLATKVTLNLCYAWQPPPNIPAFMWWLWMLWPEPFKAHHFHSLHLYAAHAVAQYWTEHSNLLQLNCPLSTTFQKVMGKLSLLAAWPPLSTCCSTVLNPVGSAGKDTQSFCNPFPWAASYTPLSFFSFCHTRDVLCSIQTLLCVF